MLANSVLEPGGPKPSVVMAAPKVIVKHDPRASLVERMRNDEAARDTAAKGETLPPPVEPMVPVAQSADHVAKAEAVQVAAPAAVTTATEDANGRSVRLAKKKTERVRRQRLARERAREVQQAASQQQAKAIRGIRFNEHMECDDGEIVFRHACKLGLEGIVSKRKDSLYRSGRSPDWLKSKNPACEAVRREAEEDWGR